jgi:transposase-like protein
MAAANSQWRSVGLANNDAVASVISRTLSTDCPRCTKEKSISFKKGYESSE